MEGGARSRRWDLSVARIIKIRAQKEARELCFNNGQETVAMQPLARFEIETELRGS